MLSRPLKERFAAAIRRLLRPVIRQMIAYGVSYPAFNRLVRELYVEVAEQHFALPFKRQTDSRLALVTGLTRKEIAQLRPKTSSGSKAAELTEVEDTQVTHLIGRWMAQPRYSTAAGPAVLAYESPNAKTPSFSQLVRDLGTDTTVRAVLDELIGIGAVDLLPDGRVALRQQAHVPSADVESKLTLLGSDPAEVFSTIVHNIDHPDEPRLQRKVVYDNIGAEALAELRAEARRVGEEFIRHANSLLASYDRDRNPAAPQGERTRVVLGAYYFEEDTPRPAPADTPPTRTTPPGRIRRSR